MNINRVLKNIIKNHNIKEFKTLLTSQNVNVNELNDSLKYANMHRVFPIVQLLLRDERVDSNCIPNAIAYASCNGHLDIIKKLLKNENVDPTKDKNKAISFASSEINAPIVQILWADHRVKNTLKQDNLYLHNKLIALDIKDKLSEF